jgi:hypothetical protein
MAPAPGRDLGSSSKSLDIEVYRNPSISADGTWVRMKYASITKSVKAISFLLSDPPVSQ